jgi:hypothetical protein
VTVPLLPSNRARLYQVRQSAAVCRCVGRHRYMHTDGFPWFCSPSVSRPHKVAFPSSVVLLHKVPSSWVRVGNTTWCSSSFPTTRTFGCTGLPLSTEEGSFASALDLAIFSPHTCCCLLPPQSGR